MEIKWKNQPRIKIIKRIEIQKFWGLQWDYWVHKSYCTWKTLFSGSRLLKCHLYQKYLPGPTPNSSPGPK